MCRNDSITPQVLKTVSYLWCINSILKTIDNDGLNAKFDLYGSYKFYVTVTQKRSTKLFRKWPKMNASSTLASLLMHFLMSNQIGSKTGLTFSVPTTILTNKSTFDQLGIIAYFCPVGLKYATRGKKCTRLLSVTVIGQRG